MKPPPYTPSIKRHSFAPQNRAAFKDVIDSFSLPRLWLKLAWRDISVQFERSFLGPFWMTLQAAAWIGAIVFVFAGIMGPGRDYSVYVAIGIVLYNFMTVIITDSSDLFIRNRIIIHSHPNPYFVYVMRQVMFGLFQLILQSLTVIVVFVFLQYPLSSTSLLAIPGLILGIFMSVSLALTFGMMGLRFGDFRFAMLAIMRLGLFITPILWTVEDGGRYKQFAAHVNPMAHFIDIVRMPLMGQVPEVHSYGVVVFSIVLVSIVGWILFCRLRHTISMWL